MTIQDGSTKTFALDAKSGSIRMANPAPNADTAPDPGQGTLMISVSTTHAVGYAKLHVYNRSSTAVTLKFAAMNGSKRLGTLALCGTVDTDSWVVLPPTTRAVRLSRFAETRARCP
jgi:hypothetical protein